MCFLLWLSLSVFVQDDSAKSLKVDTVSEARATQVIELTKLEIKELEEKTKDLKTQYDAAKRGKVNRNLRQTETDAKKVRGKPDVARKYTFPSKEEKQKVEDHWEDLLNRGTERLSELTSGKEIVFPEMPPPAKVGDWGQVDGFLVLQILGPNEMLVEYTWWPPVNPLEPIASYNARIKRVTLLIKDVSTNGVVDDAPFKTDQVFEILAPETYSTAIGGTKTVFVAKPLDTEPILTHIKTLQKKK